MSFPETPPPPRVRRTCCNLFLVYKLPKSRMSCSGPVQPARQWGRLAVLEANSPKWTLASGGRAGSQGLVHHVGVERWACPLISQALNHLGHLLKWLVQWPGFACCNENWKQIWAFSTEEMGMRNHSKTRIFHFCETAILHVGCPESKGDS